MATAREFCELALKEAGVIGVGQTPLAEDINDTFTLLNRMLAQWQKRRWLVPNLYSLTAQGNSLKSNAIGPGQFWNAPRPDKIQAAYFNQVGSDVSFPLAWIPAWEDYAKIALKSLNSWPTSFFYDAAYPYGNVYITPIPTSSYDISLVLKGPIGFTTEINGVSIVTAGTLYTNGVYAAVPIVAVPVAGPQLSVGAGATANVTVAGGVITTVEIQDKGNGYRVNDSLTVAAADIGGTGSGFTFKVTSVSDSLDSEFTMPPEYEEAIHYNLCVRLVSMYQYPPNPVQGVLAKNALNTIRNANAQIPQLSVPRSLRFNRGNSFYIYNADAR